ncbi:DUF1804 family protein [Thiocystis violascens]|uniref:Uncharacterized protein n=1 Tax=Thiocystis violascens (strain ATCC 17096 / DSM 198 / 6111) TaxID=765911 RepID=I3YGV3_THIV6|nr:DUF1804 family protein [Thiocystis violascens]AFL76221.1 Protein of unknown function (DUF1804) [Thiocystis violascens DSM 198]
MKCAPEARKRARDAYVHERQTLLGAAQAAGISLGTANRWKKADSGTSKDWDKARAAASLSGDGLQAVAMAVLEDYLLQHQATLAALRDPATEIGPLQRAEVLSRLTDSFHKAMAAHAKLSPELSRLAIAMEVMQRMANFVRARYPQHTNAFLDILEPFGETLGDAYG